MQKVCSFRKSTNVVLAINVWAQVISVTKEEKNGRKNGRTGGHMNQVAHSMEWPQGG